MGRSKWYWENPEEAEGKGTPSSETGILPADKALRAATAPPENTEPTRGGWFGT